ncbi:MAG: precorrin-2 C(20)-methyltransferase [Candidatus Bathyarchaeia archaeon]
MPGKLFGVGVGPGDPELLTLKAVKVLKSVDVVFAPKARADKPSLALKVIKPILKERQKTVELVYPMVMDPAVLEAFWERNAEIIASELKLGRDAAFVTLGDPMLYSTFIYTYKKVAAKVPEARVEVVPGVTAITMCAALSITPIAERDEAVVIVPSTVPLKKIKELAGHADTLIVVKGLKGLKDLAAVLIEAGFSEASPIVLIKASEFSREEVMSGRLGELCMRDVGDSYFSMLIVKRVQACPVKYT